MNKAKTKRKCDKCGYSFSTKGGNFKRHEKVCDGSFKPYTKLKCCKFCQTDFTDMTASERANHTRWCRLNPKRSLYNKNTEKMRQAITLESVQKRAEGIKKAHAEGKYSHVDHRTFSGRSHSEESKRKMSEKALASPHRRLTRKIIEYKGIMLDSTWELVLAERLDEQNIKWYRPPPIPWVDESGITHNYFPDFYLPDYDLFLDPKNPQAIKVQKHKLKCLLSQYKNIIILGTLKECEQFNVS